MVGKVPHRDFPQILKNRQTAATPRIKSGER